MERVSVACFPPKNINDCVTPVISLVLITSRNGVYFRVYLSIYTSIPIRTNGAGSLVLEPGARFPPLPTSLCHSRSGSDSSLTSAARKRSKSLRRLTHQASMRM